ncbi:esterase [Streptomyces sulfonofaciens]|uniref:Esterase n=1 Tax=Streptomyces sulfonofaciens TaxID=68272 RepID=A0A919GP39_9ACTN|nr:alpha/beta hydrolase [Streptomyces sulfonofaciens]GHH87633.1 esterase [Streptomyces sulfonofaciens]
MSARPVPPHALHGAGPHKVIAVHGWFADRSAYDPVLPDLDLASFQYAVVDLRGYGEARDVSGAYTTAEGAADVLALADRLGWERFSLIGHSMGGCVAQRALAAAPHRVRRIVGVSPVPASGLPLPPEQWELFTAAAHSAEHRRTILDITTGGRRPSGWLDRMVRRSFERSDAKAFRAWLDSWAVEDFHDRIDGSPVPALAVVGALDPALSAELQRATWMRWYPRAELVELSSCGHYAMDEAPLDLIRAVEDFLRADGQDTARADGQDAARADGRDTGADA